MKSTLKGSIISYRRQLVLHTNIKHLRLTKLIYTSITIWFTYSFFKGTTFKGKFLKLHL